MSLASWKEVYYPVEAKDVPASEAVAHSLRKWEGLRASVLEEHGLSKEYSIIADYCDSFNLGSSSCAMCRHYEWSLCEVCPLSIVRGNVPCDSLTKDEQATGMDSPWNTFTEQDNPEPMIYWLKKAQELENYSNAVIASSSVQGGQYES